MVVRNTGRGIAVPVGDNVLGHIFNVLGEPLDTDDIGEVPERWEIHRDAPDFDTLEPKAANRYQSDRPSCSYLRVERSDFGWSRRW